MSRQLFVAPPARPASQSTSHRVLPTAGFSSLPQGSAPIGSLSSGQNVWIREDGLEPRWRLSQVGSANPLGGTPTGAFHYHDISGIRYPLVTSKTSVSYLDGGTWTTLAYVSGISNLPPTGGQNDLWFGTSVYLERRDLNIAVMANGVNPLFTWGGPSDSTGYSTLTQAPIAKDVALLDNSILAWNIKELSSTSRFVQRVQWPVGANPEDWTGIGSGFEDLVDMRGEGTRIFTEGDEVILASTQEIWLGRVVGGPFRFQFAPLSRTRGMPYPRAAIQTPLGIFWLGPDYMIYRLSGHQIEPVGIAIQEDLRATLATATFAFFGYNAQIRAATLYYSTTAGSFPQHAWTFHLGAQAWTPQRFGASLALSFPAPVNSSATTWGGLVGTLGAQSLTYNELLGLTSAEREHVLASSGTAYAFDPSASSDGGATVTHAATLPLGLDPFRTFNFREVRLKVAATSASSLSIGFSTNGGTTVSGEQALAISASSAVSGYRAFSNLGATVPALQVRSDGGNWRLAELFVAGTLGGSQ